MTQTIDDKVQHLRDGQVGLDGVNAFASATFGGVRPDRVADPLAGPGADRDVGLLQPEQGFGWMEP